MHANKAIDVRLTVCHAKCDLHKPDLGLRPCASAASGTKSGNRYHHGRPEAAFPGVSWRSSPGATPLLPSCRLCGLSSTSQADLGQNRIGWMAATPSSSCLAVGRLDAGSNLPHPLVLLMFFFGSIQGGGRALYRQYLTCVYGPIHSHEGT